jgi:hypothetical protein
MRAAYVYASIGGVGLSMHPLRGQLLQAWDVQSDGYLQSARSDGAMHEIPLTRYFKPGWGQGITNLTILRVLPALMVLEVWEMLKQGPLPKSPRIEFLRHVRNAIAHNSRFNIRQVSAPAHFDGITITPEHHGTVLSDTVMSGDILALLDALEIELRQLGHG